MRLTLPKVKDSKAGKVLVTLYLVHVLDEFICSYCVHIAYFHP